MAEWNYTVSPNAAMDAAKGNDQVTVALEFCNTLEDKFLTDGWEKKYPFIPDTSNMSQSEIKKFNEWYMRDQLQEHIADIRDDLPENDYDVTPDDCITRLYNWCDEFRVWFH